MYPPFYPKTILNENSTEILPSLLATEKCIYARAHKKAKSVDLERKEFKGVFPFVATRMCTGDAVSFLAPEVWRRRKIKERSLGFLTLKGEEGEGVYERNFQFP